MRKLMPFVALLAMVGSANAATFTANGGVGSSTVGPGGDYTSLAAAAADFSGAQPVTGNYTFLVTGDLTETANSYFGKATAGFTVTVKPADGVSPTITYTKTNDNVGASGNLIIGASADAASSANWAATFVKTDGFTIDGSNNLGARNLTINTSGVTHTFNSLVTIVGDSDNVRVQNSKLINPNPGGSNVGGIRIASRQQTAAPAGTYVPDGTVIVNNQIDATSSTQGVGINFTGSGTFPAGTGNTSWVVENNDIDARIRGVFINQGLTSSTIHNNRITIGATGSNSGLAVAGIHVNNANSPVAHTFTVSNNRIFVTSNNSTTGANGPSGMILTSMGSGTDRYVNVFNNMVNVALTSTNANSTQVYRGIQGSSAVAYRFINNSINMPGNSNHAVNTLNAFALGGWTAVAKEAQIYNNLIKVGNGTAGIMIDNSVGQGAGILSNNNVINPSGGGFYGRWLTANQATRAAWNTATAGVGGLDANSDDTFNPVTSTGSAWSFSPSNNLSFAPLAKPDGIPGFAQVTSPFAVATDLAGDTRAAGAGQSYPGADEIPGVPLPVNVSGFQLD